MFQPAVLFFIARLDGQPVGCGGVAFEAGFAEVKRMYVRPAARGRSVARTILARLEEEALARGVTRLVLETGDAQQAAIRFYEHAGFRSLVRCLHEHAAVRDRSQRVLQGTLGDTGRRSHDHYAGFLYGVSAIY